MLASPDKAVLHVVTRLERLGLNMPDGFFIDAAVTIYRQDIAATLRGEGDNRQMVGIVSWSEEAEDGEGAWIFEEVTP